MHCPPQLALLATLVFMAFLFVRDIRKQGRVSNAIWIPFIWLTIGLTRFVSGWLGILGFPLGPVNLEDGSPLDAVVFGILILSGVSVLYQRRVNLGEVVRNNRWTAIFLAYCFLAIVWSDFPFVAFKRWIKVLGHPIMVLIMLTEVDPEEAIIQVMKRSTYVVVPLSILFIKYYPQWGRNFDSWTGMAENCGAAGGNKNLLGLDLFIVGSFYFWYLLKVWRQERSKERRDELIVIGVIGYMIGWLFHMAHSSTSEVSFFIAAMLMSFVSFRWVNPRKIGAYLVAAVLIVVVAEQGFGVYSSFLRFLGKSPTLTDRTLLWNHLLSNPHDPILGAGFESYWLGEHVQPSFWLGWAFIPNEAHNDYLETYLNLGVVGLVLLAGWSFAIFQRARQSLIDGLNWGRFQLGFLVATLFYNWTEAPFKAMDPVFCMFFLIAMNYPKPEMATATQPAKTAVAKPEPPLVSVPATA